MDLIQELNYMCNSDIFLVAYALKTTITSREEQKKVKLWVNKIMKCNRTIEDLRLRNEFLRYLVTVIQNGKLKPPFDMDPPNGSIKGLARKLPGHEEAQSQDDEIMALLRFLPAKNGGFLLPKPLPSTGAYCYISAASPNECNEKSK